ncbi:hypothetical protein NDA11_006359 [Ustilago hordei]|uniref:Ornithine decarboxylase antizyme n=1 Tax=Ustilago hordei TaxID=120017 RepID=I2FW96_USTHO|nr:uncharacterized protein UHO2_00614 [Ustilago hordei]KAJ1042180.1 hypothetical protein NDA10_000946 [Ustilago hordei]KAJ1587422.1 hypothetical protein NDA15_005469 [Ustilago hordei]KAJ1589779.1 hypothetical protein NDA12_000816 [Ustilago hordei]KAJ1594302.1 hypothetical protein NDA11_006359 [Ustilago hordei]KAJ1602396.1 hypothetical protein NDA14_004868 [Ustilago hordei]
MPGYTNNNASQRPGRSAPVRGVASQQASTSLTSNIANEGTTSSSLPQPSIHRAQQQQQQQQQPQQYTFPSSSTTNHPMGWDRTHSSGVPASAVAVPIFRAAHANNISSAASHVAPRHANAAHLPDSPPDTPPHSPGLAPVRLPALVEPRPLSQQRVSPPRQPISYERSFTHTITRDAGVSVDVIYTGQTPCDSELEDDAESDFSDDASQATLDQLTQAAQTLLLHSDFSSSKSQQQQHSRSHEAADSSISIAHRNALPIELMPVTPEISPDNDVRHHAQKSAHSFLDRIFVGVLRNLSVEDAGVELVSPGWSGAVIKSGPAGPACASSSFSSTCSSDSSAETQRTLYVSMPAVVDASLLREQVLAVLDAASEKLGCESVMVCLDRAMRDFASVLHGLCYVGGAMVASARDKKEEVGGGQNKLPDVDPVSGLQLREGLVLVAIEL